MVRIAIGLFFAATGVGKIIEPYQNFLYIVQNYDIVPEALEVFVAYTVPWIEFFIGIFLVLGLWLVWSLRSLLVLLTIFIGIVAQALIRELPITDCGCFGEAFSVPLHVVLSFDTILWLITAGLLFRLQETSQWSLDKYFLDNTNK